MKFTELPLHDAVLELVTYNISESSVSVTGKLCVKNSESFTVLFRGVKNVVVPHEKPWGSSVSINELRSNESSYEIEMQSGDVITISAESYTFEYAHT